MVDDVGVWRYNHISELVVWLMNLGIWKLPFQRFP